MCCRCATLLYVYLFRARVISLSTNASEQRVFRTTVQLQPTAPLCQTSMTNLAVCCRVFKWLRTAAAETPVSWRGGAQQSISPPAPQMEEWNNLTADLATMLFLVWKFERRPLLSIPLVDCIVVQQNSSFAFCYHLCANVGLWISSLCPRNTALFYLYVCCNKSLSILRNSLLIPWEAGMINCSWKSPSFMELEVLHYHVRGAPSSAR